MKKIVSFFLAFHCVVPVFAQVELQSGSAAFSIPLFRWQDDKSRLQTSVGLSYNSRSGLRVDEIASNIGQGWDLVGGGVITRTQVGEPDDQTVNDGNGTISDINKYPAGYLDNPVAASLGCPNQMGYYPIFGGANTVYKQHNDIAADREQDHFNAQFNGRSLQFILDKNNPDSGRTLGSSRLRIWFHRDAAAAFNQHLRTTILAFYIRDENGLIYTFSQLGRTKVLRMHSSTAYPAAGPVNQPQYTNGGVYCQSFFDEIPLWYNPWVVTSWHLTSITDPLTQRTITFNYTVRNLNNYVGDDISAHNTLGSSNTNAEIVKKTYILITKNVSVTQSPFLTSVQCQDGHQVTFNYDQDNPRIDLPGDLPLKSVEVTYNGRMTSGFRLNTTYFVFARLGMPTTEDQRAAARLCLRSVMKVGVDGAENEPPHVFDYYTGDPASADNFVPPPYYYTKDIYGYYNGNSVNALINSGPQIPVRTSNITNLTATEAYFMTYTQLKALCFLGYNAAGSVRDYWTGDQFNFNTINPGYARNGLLRTITYPSGGTLTYQYAQNTYSRMVDKQTITYTNTNTKVFNSPYVGGVHVSQTSQTDGGYSNSDAAPIVTTYQYTDATGAFTSQWGSEDPVNQLHSSYDISLDGAHSQVFGGCKYDYQYPGISYKEQAYSAADNSKTLLIVMNITRAAIMAETLTMDIITLASSGGDPAALIFDVVMDLVDFLSQDCDIVLATGEEYIYQNSDFLRGNDYPVQFSRVEVFSGNGGATGNSRPSGKTVYEFTDFTDYPLWADVRNSAFHFGALKQRAAPWAYGLPKRTTIYDTYGKKIKQTENKYDWTNARTPAVSTSSCNCLVGNANSMRADTWNNYSNPASLAYSTTAYVYTNPSLFSTVSVSPDLYQLYTGWAMLNDTYDRSFQQGDDTRYLETHINYKYDGNNYLPSKITTKQSNGDQKIKEIYYAADYTAPGVLQTMSANNMVNQPVATYSSMIKADATTPVYTSSAVTHFSSLPNGDIRATATYAGRPAQPLTGWTFDPNSPDNYPNMVVIQQLKYDGSGNLVRVQDEAGRTVTNIYDYDNKFIVATVTNADPDLDQSAYTSFETGATGGWTINGTASYSSLSVTGTRGFNLNNRDLSPNNISTDITINKPYILSFWATSHVTLGSALTLIRSGPAINGFTYYEYAVPAGLSGLGMRGSATIDELRLYPADARMKTVTYDPVAGITSDCDVNNRITYYQYDNLGRLRFIKDEKGNIVKMYEYGVKQPGALPGGSTPVAYSGPVYARLAIENGASNGAGGYWSGDLVIHFYADAAGTQPVWVNHQTVTISTTNECDNGGPISQFPTSYTFSGQDITIFSQAVFQVETTWQDEAGNQYSTTCYTSYILLPGAGYTIIQ